MSERKEILATSRIGVGYATTLPDVIRNHFKVGSGDILAFFHDTSLNLIILSTEGKNILGSTTLTKTNNITIREKVRDLLPIEIGKNIAYILEPDGRISLRTHIN